MARSSKDAVVIVFDIGCSESLPNNEEKDFLKKSQECASMIVQKKMFSQGKTEVALILMGCKDSDNPLYDGHSYSNINVNFPLEEPSWDLVQRLKAVSHETNEEVNWLEAVLVALELIRDKEDRSKHFLEKKIVIFTSNCGSGSPDTISMMKQSIEELRVELFLIHPVADAAVPVPDDGLTWAKKIVEKVNGSTSDIEEAMDSIMSFQKKKVKARAWNVCLDLGKKIMIAVSGYKKINDNQKISWTDCLTSDRQTNAIQERDNQSFSTVREVLDQEVPIVKEEIEKEVIEKEVINLLPNQSRIEKTELISGYYFGSTLVPFSDDDHKQMKYESGSKCLSVVTVTKKVYVPRYIWMGNSSYYFVARDYDECAAVAFSAFVQALDLLKSVAIVRRVYCNGNAPRIGALCPYIKTEKEYLVYIELPFANDLRQCALPELKVDHLRDDQLKAVDELIEGMDLSSPVNENSGEKVKDNVTYREWGDLLEPHRVSDPYLQYVRRCISHRALNPDAPLLEIDSELKQVFTQAPQSIKDTVSGTLKEIRNLFPNLETIEPSKKKTGWKRGIDSKVADGKSDESEDNETTTKRHKGQTKNVEVITVGMLNPIEDFEAGIASKTSPKFQVCKQMQDVILNLVLNSFGRDDYDKPKESLRLLRNTIINDDTSKSDLLLSYNYWMENVYQQVQKKFKMGFWTLIVEEKLIFITHEECPESGLTDAEVKEMLRDSTRTGQTMSDEVELDESDLLVDI